MGGTQAAPAYRHVDAGLLTFDQDLDSRRLELRTRDVVPARMRHVETRIHVGHQRVAAIGHAMLEYPPDLPWLHDARLAMAELHPRMRGQARTQRRGDVVPGPVDPFDQRLPERLVGKIGMGDVGTGDDERIE